MSLMWGTEARTGHAGVLQHLVRAGLHRRTPVPSSTPASGRWCCSAGLFALLRGTFLGRAIRACSANRDSAPWWGSTSSARWRRCSPSARRRPASPGPRCRCCTSSSPTPTIVWIGRILCVVILGGLGSFLGPALGAAVLGVGEAVTASYIDTQWATAVPYLLIIAILVSGRRVCSADGCVRTEHWHDRGCPARPHRGGRGGSAGALGLAGRWRLIPVGIGRCWPASAADPQLLHPQPVHPRCS